MVLFYCKTSFAFSNFDPCVKNLTWYNISVKLLTQVIKPMNRLSVFTKYSTDSKVYLLFFPISCNKYVV